MLYTYAHADIYVSIMSIEYSPTQEFFSCLLLLFLFVLLTQVGLECNVSQACLKFIIFLDKLPEDRTIDVHHYI